MTASNKKKVEQVDSAIQKSSLSGPKTVYRAANIPELASALKSGNAVGMTFTDKGYSSTSGDRTKAENFNRGEGSRMFQINLPKGSKALEVGDLAGGLKGEQEVLLPRNSQFKVKGVRKEKQKVSSIGFGGKRQTRTVTVEVVELDLIG